MKNPRTGIFRSLWATSAAVLIGATLATSQAHAADTVGANREMGSSVPPAPGSVPDSTPASANNPVVANQPQQANKPANAPTSASRTALSPNTRTTSLPVIDTEMLNALASKARDQIIASSRSSDAFLRANAIEASGELKDRTVPLVQLGLSDSSAAVRFTALAIIGKLKLVELAPAAERLQEDESAQVRAAALFALKMCGKNIDISPLASLLASQNPSVRGNAVLLLGMMGDRSAAPMLREMAGIPLRRSSAVQTALVHIQTAEAIVKLGDDSALDALRAGAYSQFDEVRVLAVQMMGRLGDRRMERAMVEILKNPPVELQLAAAESLRRFGHDDGLGIALESANSTLETARAQAAFTLGLFPDPRATVALAKLLDDPSEQVRLTAATAIVARKM